MLFLFHLEHQGLQLVVIKEQPGQPRCSPHEAGGNSGQFIVGQIQGLQPAVNYVSISEEGEKITCWLVR